MPRCRPHDRRPPQDGFGGPVPIRSGSDHLEPQYFSASDDGTLQQRVSELEKIVVVRGTKVVAAVPGQDHGEPGKQSGERRLGEALYMPPVDKSPSVGGDRAV